MKALTLTAAMMSAGLLFAAPVFAQSNPPQKQKRQEGGAFSPGPCDPATNAKPGSIPGCDYKQRTQEQGGPTFAPVSPTAPK
jgi:hypothetical protein